jgi:hypothetical protein
MQSFFNLTHKIRNGLTPFYLLAYRIGAFLAITGSLLFLVGWAWIMVFFMCSASWLAPTVLAPTSDKMLQFQSGYLSVAQQQTTASVAYAQAQRQVTFLTQQRDELTKLLSQSRTAIKEEAAANTRILVGGDNVIRQRLQDHETNFGVQQQLAEVRAQNESLLAAGLITRSEAIQTRLAMQSFANAVTDTKSWELTLSQQMDDLNRKRETLLGKAKSVDAMAQVKAYFDIQQMAIQNATELKTAEEAGLAAKHQLDLANAALATLGQTAYMAALREGSNLAFIPYDNKQIAKEGAEVYDCMLTIMICHKIGTIRRIYHDEQIVDFPLYNVKLSRTVRGFMVELDVTDKSAMGSSVLFVNKPLFF